MMLIGAAGKSNAGDLSSRTGKNGLICEPGFTQISMRHGIFGDSIIAGNVLQLEVTGTPTFRVGENNQFAPAFHVLAKPSGRILLATQHLSLAIIIVFWLERRIKLK